MKKLTRQLNKVKRNIKRAPLSSYVAFCFVMCILYAITELVLTSLGAPSHDTLTTCWYSVMGGEALMCALIKLMKLKGDNDGVDN